MERLSLRRIRKIIEGSAILITIVFFNGLIPQSTVAEEGIEEKELRIAIIPRFKNNTGSEEYKWLVEAIPGMLKTSFTRIKDPRVILTLRENDYAEIMRERGLQQAIPDVMDLKTVVNIGEIAGANVVAIGSFTKAEGKEIRVDVQLVDVETATSDKGERLIAKDERELFEKIDSLARNLISQIFPSVQEEESGINVVKNSSFEDGFTPWIKQTNWMGATGRVERTKEFFYSGKYSCMVENSNGDGGVFVTQNIKVKPGERYKIGARCKSNLAHDITIEVLDIAHSWAVLGQIIISSSPDWERYLSNEFLIPEGCKIVSLQCQVKYNRGVAYFDDVEMILMSSEEEEEEPSSVSLVTPTSGEEVRCIRYGDGIYRFSASGTSTELSGRLRLLLWVKPVRPSSETPGWYLQRPPINGISKIKPDGSWEGIGQIGNIQWPPHAGDVFDVAVTVVDVESANQLLVEPGVVVRIDLPGIASDVASGIRVKLKD